MSINNPIPIPIPSEFKQLRKFWEEDLGFSSEEINAATKKIWMEEHNLSSQEFYELFPNQLYKEVYMNNHQTRTLTIQEWLTLEDGLLDLSNYLNALTMLGSEGSIQMLTGMDVCQLIEPACDKIKPLRDVLTR